MPSADTLIAFWACPSCWASPRARQHFVLLQSAQRGWRAGMAVVVGLCCGLVVHTGAVALGLAAVFAASAVAFTVLKLLGAAYLAYLAWQACGHRCRLPGLMLARRALHPQPHPACGAWWGAAW